MSSSLTIPHSLLGRSSSVSPMEDVHASREKSQIPSGADYRCRATPCTPWRTHESEWCPRTLRRVNSMSNTHSNDSVPQHLEGEKAAKDTHEDGRKAAKYTHEDDTKLPIPSSTRRDSSEIGNTKCEAPGRLERLVLSKFLPRPEALRIIKFWFPATAEESVELWLGKSEAVDRDIEDKFGGLVEEAEQGRLDYWQDNPWNCLALVILLDQMTRNIFRDTARMYKSDVKMQGLVVKAIYHGHHRALEPKHLLFLPCLVLTHAESLHLQELCLEIWQQFVKKGLPQNYPSGSWNTLFKNHCRVIERFGRFPHRNVILDRSSTEQERQFLKNDLFRFDLPMVLNKDGAIGLK